MWFKILKKKTEEKNMQIHRQVSCRIFSICWQEYISIQHGDTLRVDLGMNPEDKCHIFKINK